MPIAQGIIVCSECGGIGKIFTLNAQGIKVRLRCPYCAGTGERREKVKKYRICQCKNPMWAYSKSSDYSIHCMKCFKPLKLEDEGKINDNGRHFPK